MSETRERSALPTPCGDMPGCGTELAGCRQCHPNADTAVEARMAFVRGWRAASAAMATPASDGGEVREATDAEVADACLSYRHDYGLMDTMSQVWLHGEARAWLSAWRKVDPALLSDSGTPQGEGEAKGPTAPVPAREEDAERIPKGLHWLAGEMHEIARRAHGSGYTERAEAYLEASDMVNAYACRLAARLRGEGGGE